MIHHSRSDISTSTWIEGADAGVESDVRVAIPNRPATMNAISRESRTGMVQYGASFTLYTTAALDFVSICEEGFSKLITYCAQASSASRFSLLHLLLAYTAVIPRVDPGEWFR